MAIADLINTIAWLNTEISLFAALLFTTSWGLGSAIAGSPIPFKEWKEFGKSLRTDAIKACFELMLWSSLSALVSWIAAAISSAI